MDKSHRNTSVFEFQCANATIFKIWYNYLLKRSLIGNQTIKEMLVAGTVRDSFPELNRSSLFLGTLGAEGKHLNNKY